MYVSDFTNPTDLNTVATMLTCLDCEAPFEKLQSRGLCATCYKRNSRNGTITDYPTTDFWVNRESYVRWVVEHFREDVLAELGIGIS